MIYLPEGVQDFLFEQAQLKRSIEEKLLNLYESYGYNRVQTPTFEFDENFLHLYNERTLYTFSDKEGNSLTLRPDVTTQIARIVSTKLGEYLPAKFSYSSNVFRYEDFQVGKMREFTQAGVELHWCKQRRERCGDISSIN